MRVRAQLQHHGPGQGLARGQRALPGGQPRARRASASTASRPARSRRWRPRASRTSASCSTWSPQTAPLRRNVTIDDVGNVAAFLLSDLAAGVTAEITYVDGGFSQVALGVVESPAEARRRALPPSSARAAPRSAGAPPALDRPSTGMRAGSRRSGPWLSKRSRKRERVDAIAQTRHDAAADVDAAARAERQRQVAGDIAQQAEEQLQRARRSAGIGCGCSARSLICGGAQPAPARSPCSAAPAPGTGSPGPGRTAPARPRHGRSARRSQVEHRGLVVVGARPGVTWPPSPLITASRAVGVAHQARHAQPGARAEQRQRRAGARAAPPPTGAQLVRLAASAAPAPARRSR